MQLIADIKLSTGVFSYFCFFGLKRSYFLFKDIILSRDLIRNKRASHRGQTQSQYLSFGGDDDGKAEAEASHVGFKSSNSFICVYIKVFVPNIFQTGSRATVCNSIIKFIWTFLNFKAFFKPGRWQKWNGSSTKSIDGNA